LRKKRSIFKKRPRQWGGKNIGKMALWGVAALFMLGVYFLYDLPDIDKVKPLDTKPSITILANDGALIARYGGLQGAVLGMEDLPPTLIEAVLSVEDRRFYSHFGIDPLGLARAMWTNLRAGRWVQGGSTITQQLAKNLFLTSDKTIRRKVQEALMALEIEHKFTKNEILTAYLNRVYFGAGAYGVDAAAKTYFSKPPSQLTLWESAVLAGLLKAPSRFSPATNPELAQKRAEVVIEAMKDAGYLDAKTTAREIRKIKAHMSGPATAGDFNRYFSDWVVDQIGSFISATDGDIVVMTTLDPQLQRLAEEKQKELFKKIKPQDKVSQAALVTEDLNGAVLAMIGGVDYRASQFNRAIQAERQPGSAFKPFVYLAAIENGASPDDTIEDAPIKSGDYRPDNYDDKYFGEVTLTQALAKSLNTATIRLLQQTGIESLIDVAARMGFSGTLKPELASGLGTDEVTLLELTNAYAMIANGGYTVWPYAVLSIRDGQGQLLYQRTELEHPRAFSGRDIRALDDMLVQVIEEGTGTAAQLSHGHVAGKTGTTQNYRDAWFLGYTDNLATGVWMGNDDATPMVRITGSKYPAQLWRDYMNEAIDVKVPEFAPESSAPDNGEFSGMLERWSSGGSGNAADAPDYNR
jgi:penicillin-binding protein 1A